MDNVIATPQGNHILIIIPPSNDPLTPGNLEADEFIVKNSMDSMGVNEKYLSEGKISWDGKLQTNANIKEGSFLIPSSISPNVTPLSVSESGDGLAGSTIVGLRDNKLRLSSNNTDNDINMDTSGVVQ